MPDTSSGLDATLGALADPTRRRVVESLRRRPHRAGELSRLFATSPPAMSRHLRVLRKSGLIEDLGDQADARARVYRLKPGPFRDLAAWLEEVEAFWRDELASFKDTDAAYKTCLAAGATSVSEPQDQYYGDRNAGVRDPNGNQWWLGTHLEDVPPEEIARRAAARSNA